MTRQLTGYRLALLGAIAIPIAIIGVLIAVYSVDVPRADQYELVPLFQKIDTGTLGFGDIWQQHNEHRIAFPNSILLTLARLTHWNTRVEVLASLIIAIAGFAALVLLIRQTTRHRTVQVFLVAVAGLWFFSPVQWENWLWGWQLEWFLCVCMSLYALYLLSRIKKTSRAVSWSGVWAILPALVATFSLGSGPFIWAAGLIVLLLKKAPFRNTILWLSAAALSTVAYLAGYKSSGDESLIHSIVGHPVGFGRSFLAYVGRPIATNDPYAAMLAGAMLILVCALLVWFLSRRKLLQDYAVWLALIAYSLLVGVTIGASRLDWGVTNAMSSRYMAFSLLLIIAITVILVSLLTKPGLILAKSYKAASVLVVAGVVLTPLIASSYYNGIVVMRGHSAYLRSLQQCTSQDNPTEECLYEAYFPSTHEARSRLNYLKQRHYSSY